MTTNNSPEGRIPEKVLITGGGGFLGKAIASRLIERGDIVRSLARNHYPELEALGVEQKQGNLCDVDVVLNACENRDVIFHTAAKPPPWGPYEEYYQTNVVGTRNVVEACLRFNTSRLIYTSTPSVVFNGDNLEGIDESFPYPAKFNAYYPMTKAMAEQQVVQATRRNLIAVILRPHEIWGPEDPHFVPRLLARAHKLKQIGDGKNLVDTIYIDNAADAHILAADKLKENQKLTGNIYFITQDEPIPAWGMINAILKAAGYEPVKGRIPFRVAWMIGAVLEFIYKKFNLCGEPQMTRFLAEAVATSHWFDISAAKKDLGYEPKVTIEEGLKRLRNWLKTKNAEGVG
jgi:nucleoside-diphosphate-sugar epimerase